MDPDYDRLIEAWRKALEENPAFNCKDVSIREILTIGSSESEDDYERWRREDLSHVSPGIRVTDGVAEFVAEARRYCALIEDEERGAASAFEKHCLVVLLRLYEQTLRLPSADPPAPELPERIPHEQWKAVFERTAQRTEHDQYWEVFEPFAKNKPDPIYGSISALFPRFRRRASTRPLRCGKSKTFPIAIKPAVDGRKTLFPNGLPAAEFY